MHIERVNSAYRLGLGIALAYLLWAQFPNIRTFVNLAASGARQSQAVAAAQPNQVSAANFAAQLRQSKQRNKLSGEYLEVQLLQSKHFAWNSQLRCVVAARDWDYVCSYLPTPLQSRTRLQFGVNVDATRWLKVSDVVPAETILPPPK